MGRRTREIFKGVTWVNAGNVANLAVNFLVQIVVVRRMGLETYGLLALVQTAFAFYAILFNLNVNYSAIKFGGESLGAGDEERFYRVQGTTLATRLALNSLLFATTVVFSRLDLRYHEIPMGRYFFWLGLSSLLAVVRVFPGVLFNCRKEFHKASGLGIVTNLVWSGSFAVAILVEPTVLSALKGQAVGDLLCAGIAAYVARRDLARCRWDAGLFRPMAAYGIYFAATSIMKQVLWRADILILGLFTSRREVGIYQLAAKVASPMTRLFSPLWTVLFPTVSVEMGRGDEDAVRTLLKRGTKWLMVGVVPVTAIACLFARPFLVFFYGEDAAQSAAALRILLWSYAIGTITSVGPPILRVTNNRLSMWLTLGGTILNVALNLLLVPHLRVRGAAWANLFSFGGLCVAVLLQAFSELKHPLAREVRPAAVLLSAIAIVSLAASIGMRVGATVALVAAFIAAAAAMGVLTPSAIRRELLG